ncbi:RHS repeat-associated core domain-containing protein [Telmatospirillum sp.]|uniref:RHS repeat-associated core domain-containing protein n=1 Tax=Telmatospirillum sp. TaxID=2079197 RepID=UPI00285085FE|nr:RHS repeat-associated core domain-containing protein [Telmatospirillum sp.]MDR3435273.1 RHS repeat-associated core domain-containing protein [Telmatospirillum sp.]
MEAAFAAARLGDPIHHTNKLAGFLIGGALCIGAALAVAAVVFFTGGGALAIAAAAGGVLGFTSLAAEVGSMIGKLSGSTTGKIVQGSANVLINGKPAAYAVDSNASCSKDGGDPRKVAEGSKTVYINQYNAARKSDRLDCSGVIAEGSPNVIIGGPPLQRLAIEDEVPDSLRFWAEVVSYAGMALQLACGIGEAMLAAKLAAKETEEVAGKEAAEALAKEGEGVVAADKELCTSEGHPIDVATGEVFSEHTDFQLPGPLPLVWSRFWTSRSPLEGELGHGWHHGYDWALRWIESDGVFVARLNQGRVAFFAPPLPEDPSFNRTERLILETDGRTYWLRDLAGVSYLFGAANHRGLRRLARIADANGNAIAFARDPDGGILAIDDSAGRRLTVERDASGRITGIDAPHPEDDGKTLRLVSYAYDAAGDLAASRDARGHGFDYRYDRHLLTRETRPGGLVFHFVWNDPALGPAARCVESWGDGDLYRVRLAYDPEAQVTVATRGDGGVWRYRYDRQGLVVETIDPLGQTTERQFDDHCKLLRETAADGAVSAFGYDGLGRLIRRTDAAGGTLRIDYPLGNLAGIGQAHPGRVVTPDGAEHRFFRDARGNLTRYLDPTGRERRYTRDTAGLPLAIHDGVGLWRRFVWTPTGDLAEIATARGARQRYRHDRLGRVVALRRGDDAALRLRHDSCGNLVEIQRPDGGTVALDYDPENRVTRHRDPLGRETRWRYDGLPVPVERVAADGESFRYAYDGELNLTGLENSKGERYGLDYDTLGRLTRESGFDGREIAYRYDAGGHLVEQQDVDRSTLYRRDRLGRLLETRFADGKTERFAWDAAGRLVEAVSGARRVDVTYDAAGRRLTERQDAQVLRHSYDARGRRIETLLPDGRKIDVAWGEDDLAAAVGLDGMAIARFDRDQAGREVERLAGSVRQVQAFDPEGRLIRQEGRRRAGGEAVFVRSYSYDAADALTEIADARWGATQYRYDACDRLLSVEGTQPETFVVDPAGNILASGPDAAFWGGVATGDRLLVHGDRKFDYDRYGNRVKEWRAAGGAVTLDYRYDADNRLAEVTEDSRLGRRVTRFGYDALGRRAWKESAHWPNAANDGAAEPAWHRTTFLWNGDVLLAQSDSPADPLATLYLHEPGSFRPLAQVRRDDPGGPAAIYHYHLDHLGTPKELTNDNGDVVWSVQLKAWGGLGRVAVDKIDNPIRFQGQYHDTETGLHYNRHRYYAPEEGCFIQQDPIRLAGGANIAAYGPNPVAWVDPLGLTGAPIQAGEITTYQDFVDRSVVGDNLEGHELWQHANLKANDLATTRLSTPASQNNPVIALDRGVHQQVNSAQRVFDPTTQTPSENIRANADILRDKGAAPSSTIDQLERNAIEHSKSCGM